MYKKELIDHLAAAAGLSKVQAGRALRGFIDGISSSLAAGEPVRLVGFGSFSVVERKERVCHNPRNGEKIKVAARKAVRFRAGSKLAEKVR